MPKPKNKLTPPKWRKWSHPGISAVQCEGWSKWANLKARCEYRYSAVIEYWRTRLNNGK
jgi:hypothetical protein